MKYAGDTVSLPDVFKALSDPVRRDILLLLKQRRKMSAGEIVAEFDELWNSKYALSFDDFYENYYARYSIIKHQREIVQQEEIISIENYKLQPNSMQVGFITNLKKIIEAGEDRALLISVTGAPSIILT